VASTRPAPRATRATPNSVSSAQPVAAAMRPAISRPASWQASAPSTIAVGSPERSSAAAASTIAVSTAAGASRAIRAPGAASAGSSVHAQSAGSTSVAMRPGGVVAACTASRVAASTPPADPIVRTQCDIGRAMPSMSEVSGASSATCGMACSPTTLSTPERAFFALCRLARPLARPGPRCSSVEAGRRAMRQ